MPHPYSTRERLRSYLARERVTELVDWDCDGVEDVVATVEQIDDFLERAANELDRRLAQVYSVPFAGDVTLSPSTVSGSVSDLTDWIVARELYERLDPDCPEAKRFTAKVDAAIKALKDGDEEIPGATRVDPDDGLLTVSYSAARPVFAGRRETDDADSYADNPTRTDHI